MKKAANAQLRMINAVVNFLDKEVEQINQVPRLAEKYQSLKELHKTIRKLSNEKSEGIKGITASRDQLRERVNLVAIQLSGTLVSYAVEKDLTKMSTRVKFNPSDLYGVSVNKNLDFLETLLTTAEELGATELEAYGWNQGRLDAFRKLVEQYALEMTSPREAIASRSASTKEMYDLLDQSHDVLHIDIDPLMLLFTDENSRMVEEYFTVRTVVSPGSRTQTKLEELISPPDAESTSNEEDSENASDDNAFDFTG